MSDVTKSAILHKQRSYMKAIFSKVQPHLELSAAIISGLLIFIGWLTAKLDDHTLSVTIYIVAFIIGGFAKAKEGIQSTIKNKKLNVEMLMIFAAIGSASIGYWAEGAILIFIFSLSGALETYTLNKSRKEISSLMEIQPEYALRLSDGKEELISITELRVGDQVLVKPGDRIPADGTIIRGETTVDEATITGESIPVTKKGTTIYLRAR